MIGRDRDEQAQGEGEAEVGAQVADRGDRAGVRRHEAVHGREAGERRDADGDQRDLGAAGDQVDHRHQHDQADLEEHRQADDRADERPSPRAASWRRRCPTIVSTIWSAPPESASSLANIAPSAIRVPTPAAVRAEAGEERGQQRAVGVPGCSDRPGTPTVSAPEDQGEERVHLQDRDQHDDQARCRARAARISCQPEATGSTRRCRGQRQEGGQGGHHVSLSGGGDGGRGAGRRTAGRSGRRSGRRR